MLFSSDISDDDCNLEKKDFVKVSSSVKKVTLQDGSTHLLPVVSKLSMKYLEKRRTEKRELTKLDSTNEENPIVQVNDYSKVNDDANEDHPSVQRNDNSQDHNNTSSQNSFSLHALDVNEERNTSIQVNAKSHLSIKDICCIVRTKSEVLHFLRENNLISREEYCNKCDQRPMKLRKFPRVSDDEVWYCTICKSSKSIRHNSFFNKCRTKLQDSLLIMYLWSTSCQGFMVKHLLPEVNTETIYDYFSFCRDITVQKMKREPVLFGNEDDADVQVEVDESIFGKKCKYNRGRPFKRRWLFGISDSKKHKCHMEIVDSRDETTLLNIIEKHVSKRSNVRIVSDGWASYGKLQELGYQHSVVIHAEEFVNSEGYHTNSIESVWSQMKIWMNSMHGLNGNHFDRYLCEFLYRYNYSNGGRSCCWNQFLKDVAQYYPV